MDTYSIGRKNCDIVLDDPDVSKHHAELSISNKKNVYIVDCDSTNGTYIYRDGNWEQITQSVVKSTDQIRLGKCQTSISSLLRQLPERKKPKQENKSNSPNAFVTLMPIRNPETLEIEWKPRA